MIVTTEIEICDCDQQKCSFVVEHIGNFNEFEEAIVKFNGLEETIEHFNGF